MSNGNGLFVCPRTHGIEEDLDVFVSGRVDLNREMLGNFATKSRFFGESLHGCSAFAIAARSRQNAQFRAIGSPKRGRARSDTPFGIEFIVRLVVVFHKRIEIPLGEYSAFDLWPFDLERAHIVV